MAYCMLRRCTKYLSALWFEMVTSGVKRFIQDTGMLFVNQWNWAKPSSPAVRLYSTTSPTEKTGIPSGDGGATGRLRSSRYE
ncbi:hypothetical protein AJ80_09581 [Polytolypa hystricis UAMH7299]|uniref:Uncharacterized protein n=1 Tax=Polytolypa hystricis (strain UAMH7299) TaxID=1447883 RepID=A0A2B7WNI7_POLH7|nr:hypothetical protein AJ80_09581 [Polytolypa hystricis UAMH7299]